MSLKGKCALVTGASLGIGQEIAKQCAKAGANLILFARNEERLAKLAEELKSLSSDKITVHCASVDVQKYTEVESAVQKARKEVGDIDILVNNAGLALGAPNAFDKLSIEDIVQTSNTNIHGMMFTTYAVLNAGMRERKAGTILNVTSVTGLEVPPFPGEAVYHTTKAAQEAFSNVLRTELADTNIRVLALRPGVVATHFHQQRVGYDAKMYEDFMSGYEPLIAEEVAESAIWMLSQPEKISIKALDVVPTAQRSLQCFDRNWNERNGKA